jgi:8-oxo-dGTP pyrophosphatase MutT (NUDIX family)
MARNYKVFIESKCLEFSQFVVNDKISHKSTLYESLNSLISVENIFNLSSDCVIRCSDPKREFKAFKQHFIYIKAAGGIVFNGSAYLFIERNDKWDLPKGKIDKGESARQAAIREIAEECNLSGHYIVSKICNTYHTYYYNNVNILKKTKWFFLRVDPHQTKDLKPQIEEGITQIRWFKLEEFEIIRKNTYESIKLVLDEYLKINNLD